MASKYKRNYLDSVVVRIDFDRIEDTSRIKEYLKVLDKSFPFKSETETYAGNVNINIQKDEVIDERKSLQVWEYLDAYKNKKVVITPMFVAIEYLNRSYTDSKELLKDYKIIIESFIEDLSLSSINRLGLRYINRFDLDTEVLGNIKWEKFFSKSLVASSDFVDKLKYPLIRSMNNLHLRKEEHDILIRYGIWNQDFPSENTRKEFVLDIDSFSRLAFKEISNTTSLIKEYNQNIENIFEKAIGVEIKKLLKKTQ